MNTRVNTTPVPGLRGGSTLYLDLIDSMPTRDLNTNKHQITMYEIVKGNEG